MSKRQRIIDAIRRTEARIEEQERAYAERQVAAQAEREHGGTLEALEQLAEGIVRAQEATETHTLKKKIGKLDRTVRGYVEYEADGAKTALREAAELAQRNERRNREAVEAPKAADRQQRWREERERVYRERARLKRAAEEQGHGYLELGPLPLAPPSWFESEPDGVRVTVHRPSVPMPVHNPDGTVTLTFDQDVIGGSRPGPELLTAEAQFQRQAEANG